MSPEPPGSLRLRTIMRFALDARVKTVLKEFITEAEERLDKLGRLRKSPDPGAPTDAERER